MYIVTLYADGACRGNGQVNAIGGIGVVLIGDGNPKPIKEISLLIQADPLLPVTNQRAEIISVIIGIEALKKPCTITIYSDSQYVINTMTCNWKKRENVDLWNRLSIAINNHLIKWNWIRGHGDNVYNQRCDYLATEAIRNKYVLPKYYMSKLC